MHKQLVLVEAYVPGERPSDAHPEHPIYIPVSRRPRRASVPSTRSTFRSARSGTARRSAWDRQLAARRAASSRSGSASGTVAPDLRARADAAQQWRRTVSSDLHSGRADAPDRAAAPDWRRADRRGKDSVGRVPDGQSATGTRGTDAGLNVTSDETSSRSGVLDVSRWRSVHRLGYCTARTLRAGSHARDARQQREARRDRPSWRPRCTSGRASHSALLPQRARAGAGAGTQQRGRGCGCSLDSDPPGEVQRLPDALDLSEACGVQ